MKESKQVREVDRIKWKPSMPVVTHADTEVALGILARRFKCPEGKATYQVWGQLHEQIHSAVLVTNSMIRNMMKPLDL